MLGNEIWTTTRNLFTQVFHGLSIIKMTSNLNFTEQMFINISINLFYNRAARFGKCTAVSMLLERGASINVRNNFGSTPLHLACEYGHHEIVKVS